MRLWLESRAAESCKVGFKFEFVNNGDTQLIGSLRMILDRLPFYTILDDMTRLLFATSDVPASTMKALRELQQLLMLTSGSDVQNLLAAQPVLTRIFASEVCGFPEVLGVLKEVTESVA